jgi:hypothetical protein
MTRTQRQRAASAVLASAVAGVGCQALLGLDEYEFSARGGGGASGAAGSSGAGATGGGGAAGTGGGSGGSAGSSPELGGSGPDAGPVEPAVDAVFDHYSITRGTPPYAIGADVGLLANDSPGVAVVAESITSERGAAVELGADGSFTYAPPDAAFFGDDHFDYSIGEASARVRVSLQPGVVRGLGAASEVGNGFVIEGPPVGGGGPNALGNDAASAGDIDADGLDDIVVSAAGLAAAYVVFGKASSAPVQLSTLAAGTGFVVNGGAAPDGLYSSSLSGAGDLNGDGFDDLVFGIPGTGGAAGVVSVIFGGEALRSLASITLGDPLPVPGAVISHSSASSAFGAAVSSAGDVNADGFDDLLIGAPGDFTGGSAFVLFGRADLATLTVGDLSLQGAGFEISGDADSIDLGHSVAGGGDVDGDGLADILLGAPSANGNLGEGYVVFGKLDATLVSIGNIEAGLGGFLLQAPACCGRAGDPVSMVDDVDGDGLSDLLLGHVQANRFFVAHGRSETAAVPLESAGFQVQGDAIGEAMGFSLGGGGDVNGDGRGDVLVGGSFEISPEEQGGAYLVFGKAGSDPVAIATLEVGQNGGVAFFGIGSATSVAHAGDLDRDGLGDVLIGAPSANGGAGRVYALFGWNASDALGARDGLLAGTTGDDTLELSTSVPVRIAGGRGNDTLVLGGAGLQLDVRERTPDVTGIERIDLRGTGDNTLLIDDASLRRMSDNRPGAPSGLARTLVILGNEGDRVVFDRSGYVESGSNAGLEVWAKSGAAYGLEISPSVSVEAP